MHVMLQKYRETPERMQLTYFRVRYPVSISKHVIATILRVHFSLITSYAMHILY